MTLAAAWRNPWLLLALTMLFWAGNAVAGRLAVGQVSPTALTFLRWGVAALIIVPLVGRQTLAAWPRLRPRLGFLALCGIFGFTLYNLMYYQAAHTTGAINIAIVTAASPAMLHIGAWLAFRTRISLGQVAGTAVAFAGVVVVASGGSWASLMGLRFATGDLLVLLASMLYAAYSLALRLRPAVSSLVFFAAITPFAAGSALVPLAVELAQGGFAWPSPRGWAVVAYTAVFPSLLAQIFWVRGVELIGPGRAGLSTNLIPIFAAVLAWLVLGETPGPHHAAGLLLVLAGIGLAEWLKPSETVG